MSLKQSQVWAVLGVQRPEEQVPEPELPGLGQSLHTETARWVSLRLHPGTRRFEGAGGTRPRPGTMSGGPTADPVLSQGSPGPVPAGEAAHPNTEPTWGPTEYTLLLRRHLGPSEGRRPLPQAEQSP